MRSPSIQSQGIRPSAAGALRPLALWVLVFVGSACGGGGGDTPATTAPATAGATRSVPQSDLAIAQQLYADSQRKPVGFYSEPATDGLGAVATMHLKNTDLASGAAMQHELCTDDWNQALAWSEASANNSSPYSNLMATNDNERYFEFGRLKPTQPTLYVRARVYKCAYLNRGDVDLQNQGSSAQAGMLNVQPITADMLRTFSEYLWQFTMYNNTGNAVLLSSGASAAQNLSHTLYVASLFHATSPNTCDRVNVVAWTHTVNTTTGQVQLNVAPDFGFNVRRNAGVVELCSG